MPVRTIWNQMTADGGPADVANAPYVSTGSNNYYELYLSSTRKTRKHEHALKHCFAMAKHCYQSSRFPEGCDWLVAAAAVAQTEDEILPRVFDLWAELRGDDADSWPNLLLKPPRQLGARLIGITVLRIFEATEAVFSRDMNTRFLDYILRSLPDICSHLQIKDSLPDYQQIHLIQQLTPRLQELLQALQEASQALDLNSMLLRQHRIMQALNHKLVSGILSPHLPSQFTKTTLPAVLKCAEELDSAVVTQFVEVSTRTRAEIRAAIDKLRKLPTFFSLEYLLPFLTHLASVVEARFEASNATKPASVSVQPFPRKYPFHAKGTKCRLRFILENTGPGPAYDVELEFEFSCGIEPQKSSRILSELEVGRCIVDIDVVLAATTADSNDYYVKCLWSNYDKSQEDFDHLGKLGIQSSTVDWNGLIASEPYSKEAIPLDSDRPFIGRESDLLQLFRTIASKSMGSAYVHGQKRVGKTSLALAAAKRALAEDSSLFTVYLEGGDYVQPSAEGTLRAMGESIARKIRRCSRALDRIPLPTLTDSLQPLNEYVDEVSDTLSDSRFLIILDEFDELPIELYARGPIGNGLFLGLRALSGRQRLGIFIVGGEKINHIIAAQGDKLNRFEAVRIDYFRKEDHWSDFQELVRMPVSGAIDWSDGAVDAVYRWSAGNPYFTNMVCEEILRHCLDRRDAYVSEFEVEECAQRACKKAGANSFAHFWEDGILDTGVKVEEVSIQRRKVLLALAKVLRQTNIPSKENLSRAPDLLSLSSVSLDRELKQFVERGVLTEENGLYQCRVFMFEQFLRERSAELITTEFTDQDKRSRQERQENEAYVTASELLELTERWGLFNGRNITAEHLRAWLDQFDTNIDRRLMFQVLKSVRFYTESMVREKLRDAMTVVRRGTVELRRERERYRGDILVTYLGGFAKSSAAYGRMFCKENRIVSRNAVGHDELETRLYRAADDVRGVVILDDIIGTGQTAIETLKEFGDKLSKVLRATKIPIFLLTICGFEKAKAEVESFLEERQMPVTLHVCDLLSEGDRAFSSVSNAFFSTAERDRAKEVAYSFGLALEKKWPLGYGDSQALVVFWEACPNNTLPILWKKSKDWRPLFERR